MMRALSISLVLVMAAGETKMQAYADAGLAATEAGVKCRNGDIDGAMDVLEAHGKPLALQNAKEFLKTCFMEDNGACLLGKAKCAWMKECLNTEGLCENVPVLEAFLEIPGGKDVVKDLQAESKEVGKAADNLVSTPVTKLVDTAKKLKKSVAGSDPASTLLNKGKPTTPLQALKNSLGFLKGARALWFDYLPAKNQKQFAMELGAAGLFFRAACATSFKAKVDDETGRPLYGLYQPMGEKGPKYTAPLYDIELKQQDEKSQNDWACEYPKTLMKEHRKHKDGDAAQHLSAVTSQLANHDKKSAKELKEDEKAQKHELYQALRKA